MCLNYCLCLSLVAGMAPLVALLKFGGSPVQHSLNAIIEFIAARFARYGRSRCASTIHRALLGIVCQGKIAYGVYELIICGFASIASICYVSLILFLFLFSGLWPLSCCRLNLRPKFVVSELRVGGTRLLLAAYVHSSYEQAAR